MQAARKLGARTDSELGVDVRQVARDCALAEKQRSGDLLVGAALGHKRGDATFGLGELIYVCRWAASDASQLGTRFGRPQRRGQPVENLLGAFEVRARGRALLGASLVGAESEESAGVLERVLRPLVLSQGSLELLLRAGHVTARRQQERAAPRRDRKSPGTVERAGALLPRRQLLLCFPQVADCDQRFECVRELETVARLEEHRGVADFPTPSQVPECLFGFAIRKLDEAEDRSMPGFGNPNPLGLRASEGAC